MLWKEGCAVLDKIEDQEGAGSLATRITKDLNAEVVGIGDPGRKGENPLNPGW